jgi:hypothetical protein
VVEAVRLPVSVVAGIVAVAASVTVPSAAEPAPSPPSSVSCPQVGAPAYAGAAASLGLDATGAASPVWSAAVGSPEATEGGLAFVLGNCIVAVDVATGRVAWTSAPIQGGFGLVADGSTLLVSTGVQVGQAPGMVSEVIAGLTAYDPRTGAERWSIGLPDDGQQFPAVLAGGVVVVSQADGSVLGLSEQDGHQLWSDPAPTGCAGGGEMGGLQPDARAIGTVDGTGRAAAAVAYSCPGGGGVADLDAVSGRRLWAWEAPEGWEVDRQRAVTVTTGVPGGDAVAVPISLVPPANAPPTVAPAPGPSRETSIDSPYGDAESEDVVVLDPSSGRPRWDLEDLAGQWVTVVGGAGSLCVATDAGVDCRSALHGTPRWSEGWPGSNASISYPALECLDLSALSTPCIVADGAEMDVVTAAASAPAYPLRPGPPTPAGAFLLTALDMTSGRTVASLTLPSFNNPYSDHGVSLALPPAVVLAAGGLVLVSPQYEETDVVEAFAVPPES